MAAGQDTNRNPVVLWSKIGSQNRTSSAHLLSPQISYAGELWTPLLALSTECPISWAGSSRARVLPSRQGVSCSTGVPGDSGWTRCR